MRQGWRRGASRAMRSASRKQVDTSCPARWACPHRN